MQGEAAGRDHRVALAGTLHPHEVPVLSTEPGLRFETAMASSVASRNKKQRDAEAAPNQCDRAQKQDCRIHLTAALQFHGVTPPEPSEAAHKQKGMCQIGTQGISKKKTLNGNAEPGRWLMKRLHSYLTTQVKPPAPPTSGASLFGNRQRPPHVLLLSSGRIEPKRPAAGALAVSPQDKPGLRFFGNAKR